MSNQSVTGTTNGALWRTVDVDVPCLKQLNADCEAIPVMYEMGAKTPDVLKVPIGCKKVDCSGYIRWLIYHATHGALLLPDGSFIQDRALGFDGFKRSTAANTALKDGHVRVCVHIADDMDGTGHVWIVIDGVTYESHGGVGVKSRAYNAPLSHGHTLDQLATHVFVLC